MAAFTSNVDVKMDTKPLPSANLDRLKLLYPMVNEEETPLPRSWSPKDKFNYIGLSQNNLRVHYKGIIILASSLKASFNHLSSLQTLQCHPFSLDNTPKTSTIWSILLVCEFLCNRSKILARKKGVIVSNKGDISWSSSICVYLYQW